MFVFVDNWLSLKNGFLFVYFLNSVKMMIGENLNVFMSKKYNVCIEYNLNSTWRILINTYTS